MIEITLLLGKKEILPERKKPVESLIPQMIKSIF